MTQQGHKDTDEQELIPTGPQSWSQLRRSAISIETRSKYSNELSLA
jgi:hypothetical protein